jgi:twitching motility protein PilI
VSEHAHPAAAAPPDDPGADPRADLFPVVAGLDARLRDLGTRLPNQAPPVERWAGVLFRLRDRWFLAPLDQVAEVLEVPAEVTPIAGTRPWVLGVANNRGTLLPIFDLASLVFGGSPARRDSERVLAARQPELPCGLVVSEAVGIRHFEVTERLPAAASGAPSLDGFVDAAFPMDAGPVPVLSLERLLADPLLNAG